MTAHRGFDLHSSDDYGCLTFFFSVPVATYRSSTEKYLFISIAHFQLHWFLLLCFFVLLLSCFSPLYLPNINPMSDVQLANIFSHSVDCLFSLLIVSFALQKAL